MVRSIAPTSGSNEERNKRLISEGPACYREALTANPECVYKSRDRTSAAAVKYRACEHILVGYANLTRVPDRYDSAKYAKRVNG
jgi:hypothetical protein